MYKPTDEEIEQGSYEDDSVIAHCFECGEHCSIARGLDKDGDETGEDWSNCCSSSVWEP